jgi:DUF4097 and DUF4098 domain-containing protein YvlB
MRYGTSIESDSPRQGWLRSLVWVTSLLVFVPAVAQDDGPLAVEASGVIDVVNESLVRLRGLHGTITVRAGKAAELQFAARALNNRRDERPIELWLHDGMFALQPVEGSEDEPLLVEVSVPPGMRVDVEASDSRFNANGLNSPIRFSGSDVIFNGRGLQDSADLSIEGGSVTLIGAANDVSLEGKGLELRMSEIDGFVTLSLEGSSGRLDQVRGDASIDLQETSLSWVGAGHLSGDARGGRLELAAVQGGARLRLSETALSISASSGDLEFETDTELAFSEIDGSVRITGYGGSVTGAGTSGAFALSGSDMEVAVEQVGGGVTVDGDHLELRFKGVKGDATLRTSLTNVYLEEIAGNVGLTNEFGNIVIHKPAQEVQIESSEGLVKVTELSGPIRLKASGPEVYVHWKEVSRTKEHYVENGAGEIRALFAPRAGGKLVAETRRGQIESGLDGVTLSEDASRAEGDIHRVKQPVIKIVGDGNIYLQTSAEKPKPAVKKRDTGS